MFPKTESTRGVLKLFKEKIEEAIKLFDYFSIDDRHEAWSFWKSKSQRVYKEMENNDGKSKDFSNSEDLVTQQLSLSSTYDDSQIIARLLDINRNSATLESDSTSQDGDSTSVKEADVNQDGGAARDMERRNEVSTESQQVQEESPKHMDNTGDIITRAWDGYIDRQSTSTGDGVEDEHVLSQNSTKCSQNKRNSGQGKSDEDAATRGESVNIDGDAGITDVADDLWLLMNVGGNTSKYLSYQDKKATEKTDNQSLSTKKEQDENQEPEIDSTEIVKKRRKRQPIKTVDTDGNARSEKAETSVRRSRRSRKANDKGDIFGNVDSEGELVNNDEQSRLSGDSKEMNNTDTMTDDANPGGKVPCPQCGTVLANNASLTVHMRAHSGEKPYFCGVCQRAFSTRGNQIRHERTHKGDKPYECMECHKCFTEKKSLKVHMRSHTGERPFKCPVCDRGFTQSGILRTHMHLHTGQKGHLCDFCGKSFRQKSQLQLHQRRHENKRPFICECGSSFVTNGDLKRHTLKHTGERPFLCNFCTKRFTRQQYLKEHLNQHTGTKPYSCDRCDLSFFDMAACYRHVKKHKAQEAEKLEEASVLETVDCDPSTKNNLTYIISADGLAQIQGAAFAKTPQGELCHIAYVDPAGNLIGQIADPNNVYTTVDFSAINLLAEATTQKLS